MAKPSTDPTKPPQTPPPGPAVESAEEVAQAAADEIPQADRSGDFVRITCRGVKTRAGEIPPVDLRTPYQGKLFILPVGGKGLVMTRATADHIVFRSKHWSFQADLLVEPVS